MLQKEQAAFVDDLIRFLTYIRALGWSVTLGEAYRTKEQQRLYLEQGKTLTMNSAHRKRLAIDLNFFTPEGLLTYKHEDIEPFGKYWKSLSPKNRWGGDIKKLDDTNHFERGV